MKELSNYLDTRGIANAEKLAKKFKIENKCFYYVHYNGRMLNNAFTSIDDCFVYIYSMIQCGVLY